ncbi:MAG: L,D-transpeptidase family protein [Marinobacter sp.]|uniref:L,D-transpeptidase family protein n=1 Tax=Marinobacter sp. TaxID=50741 RepID=UPI00299DBC41|nr:L,D-transpeptidase family protein [Marinobacter sp.]MDX1634592.1 L,D-transpeptidase family protein [Marinobacter sp.]
MAFRTVSVSTFLALGLTLWSSALLASEELRQRLEALNQGHPVTAFGEPLMAREALFNFYHERAYTPAWDSADHRRQMVAAIARAAEDGLEPNDYHVAPLRDLLEQPLESLQPTERVDLDLLLSDSFLMLASHLLEGKVNPESIDAEWLANRRQRLMAPVLTEALASADLTSQLAALRPAQAGYAALLAARASLLPLLTLDWSPLPAGPALKPGMVDDRVPALRQRLVALGDLPPEAVSEDTAELAVDPVAEDLTGLPAVLPETADARLYDEALQASVRRFQARHGLEDDAVVGRDTLSALNVSPGRRLQQVDLNLERWRWLPDQLGDTHVMVNIAGFEMRVMANGEERLRKRVIVGRPYRRTPVFSDQIRYLVFNPTWTVPRKLMVQDKLPEIIADPDYLNRLGFTVYDGWGADRQVVDPLSIDWTALTPRNFPYQLVQEPGPENALGQVKFMFPNKFDVYLHDTPARDLFSQTERSFSSGCIRVEDPLTLAAILLADDPAWTPERIQQLVDSKKLTTVTLKKPVPVHLEYWTAWVDEAGHLHFRKDIYQRDDRLLLALRTPLNPMPAVVAENP